MARGSKNQPKKGCWPKKTQCEIKLYEQKKHRDASAANGMGFCGGTAGKTWQSHHLLCITSFGNRSGKTPKDTQELNDALYITVWNINDDPNMIGMPQKKKYKEAYGKIEKMTKAAQTAAWAATANTNTGCVPANIPAHNVDHNITGGYTDDVITYLKSKIWNNFSTQGADHQKDAKWLADELNAAAKEFQKKLLNVCGIRKSGTVAAWKNRLNDKDWCEPFSMATTPTRRKAGKTIGGSLRELFKRL